MDIFGNDTSSNTREAERLRDEAAADERKAARLLREEAEALNRQADATEEGRLGGETSSSWNPFG